MGSAGTRERSTRVEWVNQLMETWDISLVQRKAANLNRSSFIIAWAMLLLVISAKLTVGCMSPEASGTAGARTQVLLLMVINLLPSAGVMDIVATLADTVLP